MKSKAALVGIGSLLAVVVGCGGERVTPKSLADARADFVRVHDGAAARLDPTDVHEADIALRRAEASYEREGDSHTTNALAIIADRMSLYAEAQAGTLQAEHDMRQAQAAIEASRAQQLQSAQAQLGAERQVLGQTEMQLQEQRATTAAQQAQLRKLQANLNEARETIAKIATVKDDDRGMVITLSGEVLFKTDKSDLKPAAMARLDQIAQALKDKDQPIVVHGYTDSVGTPEHNKMLSQSRAQTVRDYLVSKGIPKDVIEARGDGPDSPVADNTSIEGRAQNRRVEIVVEPRK